LDPLYLTTLHSGSFYGLESLVKLELGGTPLTKLPSFVFNGLESLTELYLGSYITEVEPYAFYGLSAFTGGSYGLSFDGNPLTTLHSGSFYGLENLVKLEL